MEGGGRGGEKGHSQWLGELAVNTKPSEGRMPKLKMSLCVFHCLNSLPGVLCVAAMHVKIL